jgi:hypothetical protein
MTPCQHLGLMERHFVPALRALEQMPLRIFLEFIATGDALQPNPDTRHGVCDQLYADINDAISRHRELVSVGG